MKRWLGAVGLAVLLVPGFAAAQGINTNVALAVAQGEGIFRSQLRVLQAHDDPQGLGREVDAWVAPQTVIYGVTPRLTAFATLQVLARRRVEAPDGRVRRDAAVGDFQLLGRYTVFADDYAPLSTRRVALLAGVKFPTGAERFGTPSVDPILGGVATWAANRHELDLDALFTITTRRHGFEAGDVFRYDLAYRYRLWPGRFGRRLQQLNGVLDLNGRWQGRTHRGGRSISASGGNTLYLSPGLQFIVKDYIVEASFQVPVWQDRNGPQLEEDYVAVLSVRIPFEPF